MIRFRPLVQGDLPALCTWLGRPHVSRWWGAAPSLAQVKAEYLPLIDPASSMRGHVALHGGREIGFVQCYVVMDAGDGWWENEDDAGARGIDLLLADPRDLGQGLGCALVRSFVELLFTDPDVSKVQADPAPDNERAIRSCLRAGFERKHEVQTPDGVAVLMVRDRRVPAGGIMEVSSRMTPAR